MLWWTLWKLKWQLKSDSSVTRRRSVEKLGDLGNTKAVKPLIAALKDSNELMRIEAAKALAKIDDKRAVEPLIVALKDSNLFVRRSAADALAKIGDKRAVEPLMAALKDSGWHMRGGAAEALGKIGDKRAVEPLIVALKDSDKYVRREAATALGKIGDEQVKKSLVSLLKDDDSAVRQTAADALEQVESPEVEQALLEYRRSEGEARRLADESQARRLAEEMQKEAEARRKAEEEAKRLRAMGPRQTQRLTLEEALIFVKRTISEAGGQLMPHQHIAIMELLGKTRRATPARGAKVQVSIGDETLVATVSMLTLSLVFFRDFNGLIVTNIPESARGFFVKGVFDVTGITASDFAQRCGKKFAKADSLFQSHDLQSLEQALCDHDTIPVMHYATLQDMRSQRHLSSIQEGLRKVTDVVKVSPRVLEVYDDVDLMRLL